LMGIVRCSSRELVQYSEIMLMVSRPWRMKRKFRWLGGLD